MNTETMASDLAFLRGSDRLGSGEGTLPDPAESEIAAFYVGRSVLITGATGFMGKVLVEKLLRSCPGIRSIYLLMRPKRGQEPKARLNELLSAQVNSFSRTMSHQLPSTPLTLDHM